MDKLALIPDRIFTGTEWIDGKAVVIENGVVHDIVPHDTINSLEHRRLEGGWLVPSFIDIQIYGAYGKLLAVYPDSETLKLTYEYCRAGGATLYQPTVATNTLEVFYRCIDAVRDYWNSGGEGVWGLHLEGPWISEAKRGAHIKELIHPPTLEEARELLEYGKDVVTMITLAPEVVSREVVELIGSYGVVISAGHSNATFAQAMQAFDAGIPTITHLFNAMSPLQHREPGMVGAAFLHPRVKASIIPDGHHVDFDAIRIAKRQMGERLFVITDAVTETTTGHYQHYLAGDKYESAGTLSGSSLNIYQCFMNLVEKVGIEVDEALRMCSLYPAQVLGCADKRGKIAPGCAAQFVVLNKQLTLVETLTL
ncbi:MAG TPA: N-acetylglucosamine-6-phosphate deacetylase [Chitinophagaceae bacterium]